MCSMEAGGRDIIMKKKIEGLKMPTDTEIEKGLMDAVNMGLIEVVPGPDGKPGFRITKRGEERVEKLMRDADKKAGKS